MIRRLALTVFTLFVVFATAAHACPSCKEGLSGVEKWAQGFNVSILFMMAMPFALVAMVGGALYYNYRRRHTQRDEPDSE